MAVNVLAIVTITGLYGLPAAGPGCGCTPGLDGLDVRHNNSIRNTTLRDRRRGRAFHCQASLITLSPIHQSCNREPEVRRCRTDRRTDCVYAPADARATVPGVAHRTTRTSTGARPSSMRVS
ncbi:hypothetical protein C8Q80DRAFT_643286 [Daedaleopsis nitida]|nr:hypothetical protein C8Q80DRAFT_643286 [Daedaleopsis nitida]